MTLYVFDNPNLTNTTTNLLDKQTQQHLKKLHQKGLIKTIPPQKHPHPKNHQHHHLHRTHPTNHPLQPPPHQQTQRTHRNIPLRRSRRLSTRTRKSRIHHPPMLRTRQNRRNNPHQKQAPMVPNPYRRHHHQLHPPTPNHRPHRRRIPLPTIQPRRKPRRTQRHTRHTLPPLPPSSPRNRTQSLHRRKRPRTPHQRQRHHLENHPQRIHPTHTHRSHIHHPPQSTALTLAWDSSEA